MRFFFFFLQWRGSLRPRLQPPQWNIKPQTSRQEAFYYTCKFWGSCLIWFYYTDHVRRFQGTHVPENVAACFSVSGVYFICPLTGETLKKSERETHVKEAILMVGLSTRSSPSPSHRVLVRLVISETVSFCRNSQKIQWRLLLWWFTLLPKTERKWRVPSISSASERFLMDVCFFSYFVKSLHFIIHFSICHRRYIDNICKNPTEEKYRKIKVSNKVFQVSRRQKQTITNMSYIQSIICHFCLHQEKVSVIEGSREFLQAVGFESTMLPVDGQGKPI